MPTTRRSRILATPIADVWTVVADPHHLVRWWPRVQRVEAVQEDSFTEVLATSKGAVVRADFTVTTSQAPRLRAWRQELEGTPFARFLASAQTEIRLEPEARGGTRITLEARETPQGFFARFGGVMMRRAAGRRLDDALDALERIVG